MIFSQTVISLQDQWTANKAGFFNQTRAETVQPETRSQGF